MKNERPVDANLPLFSSIIILLSLTSISIMSGLCFCIKIRSLFHKVKSPDTTTASGKSSNRAAKRRSTASADGSFAGSHCCAEEVNASGSIDSNVRLVGSSEDPDDVDASAGIYETTASLDGLDHRCTVVSVGVHHGCATKAADNGISADLSSVDCRDRHSALASSGEPHKWVSLRESFIARLSGLSASVQLGHRGQRQSNNGAHAAVLDPDDSNEQLVRPSLDTQKSVLSTRSQTDRELPPVPAAEAVDLPPSAASGAPSSCGLLRRHLTDIPLPAFAQRLANGSLRKQARNPKSAQPVQPPVAPPLSAASPPAPADAAEACAADAPVTAEGLPTAVSVYTIDSDLTSEADPLYTSLGPGQQQQQQAQRTQHHSNSAAAGHHHHHEHIYASISRATPHQYDSAASDSDGLGTAAGSTINAAAAAPPPLPPLPRRNYGREEVDRILQMQQQQLQQGPTYYSSIELDA
uniref:RING-type domain-containing protein n=1 Tax=Macrostomum lignano TaxID=282301 RepID=A0A1I8HGS9_9PLAT